MWEKLHDPRLWPLILIVVWLGAWAANGLYGTKFDLVGLKDFSLFILGKYGVDSWLNTPKGSI